MDSDRRCGNLDAAQVILVVDTSPQPADAVVKTIDTDPSGTD
jgi:hypothetical protein